MQYIYIYGVKKTEKAFFIFFNNLLQLKPQGVQCSVEIQIPCPLVCTVFLTFFRIFQ